jgi:hypothetical protein
MYNEGVSCWRLTPFLFSAAISRHLNPLTSSSRLPAFAVPQIAASYIKQYRKPS